MVVTVLAVLAALHVVTCLSLSQVTDTSWVSLSNTTSTWTKANTTCRLYQPAIYFNDSGAFLDINSSIINRTQPWVGYVRAFTAFDYKGCWPEGSLTQYANQTFRTRTSSMCFSACLVLGMNMFAIKKLRWRVTCYCLNRVNNSAAVSSSQCSEKCSGLPCGNQQNYNYMSVYQLATLQANGTNRTVCWTIAINNTNTWNQCGITGNNISGIVCKYESNSRDTFQLVNKTNQNWTTQVMACPLFNITTSAEMKTDINAVPLSAFKLYWTVTFGTMVIRRGTDMDLGYPVIFGYYNGGNISFKEDRDDENALCEIFPTTASTPTTETDVPTTASTPTTETDVPTTASTPTTETDVSTTASTPTTETDGLWIGLGVGLSMAFGVCVAVIVIYLKCRHLSTATSKGKVQTLVVANTAYDAPLPQEQTLENIGTLYAENNYFVLEKTNYCAALPNAQTCHASHQMAESVYDVSGERALHKMPTENVYNNTRSFPLQESVYNHTSTSFAGSEAFRTSTNPVTEIVEHVYGPNSATGQKGYFETENVYNVSNHKYDRGGEYDQTNTFLSTKNGLPKSERSDHFSTNTVHDTKGIYSDVENAYELSGEINQNRAIYHAKINTADNQNSPTGSKTSIGEDEQYAVCGKLTSGNDAIDDDMYTCLE